LFARLRPEIDILMTMQYICAVVKYRDGHATRISSIMAQLIGEEEVMRFEDALKQESFNSGLAEGKLAGKLAGMLAGKLEGKREGMLAGKLEGRQEISKRVALQLLRRGTSANDVAQIVDITLEQVIDLTAELEH
jgi:predicted transposase YdaD